jgi:hypothetical protein
VRFLYIDTESTPLDNSNQFEACETRQELKYSFRSGDRNDQYFVSVLVGKRTFIVPIQPEGARACMPILQAIGHNVNDEEDIVFEMDP